MPGVIMENGSRNGSHTNHDRDQLANGVNGSGYVSEKALEKGKGRVEPQQNMTPISPTVPNGLNGVSSGISQIETYQIPRDMQERINQLPPEIAHITQGYMDLKMMISRLAQKTHGDLIKTIQDLAQMPLPPAITNGNTDHVPSASDTSQETLNKKSRLLKFANESHEAWTKALVITGWSRHAEDVSKIIDLKIHLDEQGRHYSNCIDTMAFDKRSLKDARLPNPDLRTALEAMGTGKASWMPDLGYIQPPPLTSKEVLRTFEKLNTLLSERLGLYDYDKIPYHFKDFDISNGRVTFKVSGEFEVDLTITEEEPEAQFWFIDIRFQFWPSLDILTPQLRYFIDQKMNNVLREDGLAGCYKVLHEMVLTHKINEFRRQAIVLATSRWIPTLKVELLHRAISVQYWADRFDRVPKTNGKPLRSWLIMGVHSGKRKEGRPHPKDTSRLFVRWFRDSKEVKDVEIPFDDVQISTEKLLRFVISKHIAYILTTIYENLRDKPLYKNRDLDLALSISETDGAESELKVQLTTEHRLSIKIEPITGRFIFGPPSRRMAEYESGINANVPDPANRAHESLERLRYNLIIDGMLTNGRTVGWNWVRNPGVKNEQLQVAFPKAAQTQWFRRSGWVENWYLVLVLSMSGERWFLVQTAITASATNPNLMMLAKQISMPVKAVSPATTYSFLTTLSIFAAALISYHENLKTLWTRKDLFMLVPEKRTLNLTLPAIYIKLSDLLPSRARSKHTGEQWAKDVVKLTFQGVEIEKKSEDPAIALNTMPEAPGAGIMAQHSTKDENAVMITEARMLVPLPAGVTNINEKIDRDIAFHPSSGSFAFRLRSKVGEPIIDALIRRVISVERLVDFIQVVRRHEKVLRCESISLDHIVFTYGAEPTAIIDNSRPSRFRAKIDFSAKESNMSLVLEKGNPHLRIVDYLTSILNASQGLDAVAVLLPLTLPVLCGLDTVEDSWTGELAERGEVFINVRATDWYIIRYTLREADSPKSKKIQFDIRMRHRRGEAWWYVRRSEFEGRKRDPDELDEMLKILWSEQGSGWMGMRVSGVAQSFAIEELLGKVNEVVRTFALSDKAFAEAPVQQQENMPIQQNKPKSVISGQGQRLQQPTPSQSQSQSHSQGSIQSRNPLKRTHEVVEID